MRASKRGGWATVLAGVLGAAGVTAGATNAWLAPVPPAGPFPAGEAAVQWDLLQRDLGQRARFAPLAPQTFRPEALILAADRDPLDITLRRTGSLLADLRRQPAARDLAAAAVALAALEARAAGVAVTNTAARRTLFEETCVVRRRIAFANPLLSFRDIAFVKRNQRIYGHMCDQFYGAAQQPGGGLFVLEDAFGPAPRLRDVLADAVVANGRLKGQALGGGPRREWNVGYDGMGHVRGEATEGGAFVTPDLSFDGRTLAFAYTACTGDGAHRTQADPTQGGWPTGRCFHVFTVDVDGRNLRMLTDGAWNDFDPCFLPSGRLAFITERRGGYLRCGRVCPNYTLYDMAAAGGDIRCLSFHETNEWNPSVTHDGMIVWTRWDYVDRHGCTAHQPWITTPDGRDPRSVHGNFALRHQRPDMEVDVRAIPGSHRFVATGAPHHGVSFGSLVVIDPRVADDDAMAPLKRLTPEVGFPESQGGAQAYGTAWPLSEDYYLCAYDPEAAGGGRRARQRQPNGYGLYLLDSFGNKELLYADPDIACVSPLPLQPRPTPPVVPDMSERVPADQPATATVAIVDVYRALLPWPAGTQIKALRIYQIYPALYGTAQTPHAVGIQIPQASDSINLARSVLGTVPVEADGSAHFTIPARREVYFQALDERGLAVTSMRSSTHFQPGERVMCQGCHEPKGVAPQPRAASQPLALRRPPSPIAPDVDGTCPFSYPRLVQPVLERNCLACHQKNPDKAPRLDAEVVRHTGPGMYGNTRFYASYVSLAPKYGFYDYGGRGWNDPKFYRTTPGAFGARASLLFALLEKGHHDVKLPPEDWHRLMVWLDSVSLFYGVYDLAGADRQLRGEIARAVLE